MSVSFQKPRSPSLFQGSSPGSSSSLHAHRIKKHTLTFFPCVASQTCCFINLVCLLSRGWALPQKFSRKAPGSGVLPAPLTLLSLVKPPVPSRFSTLLSLSFSIKSSQSWYFLFTSFPRGHRVFHCKQVKRLLIESKGWKTDSGDGGSEVAQKAAESSLENRQEQGGARWFPEP